MEDELFVAARCVENAIGTHLENAIRILKKKGRGKYKAEYEALAKICEKLSDVEEGIRNKIWSNMPKGDNASCPIKTEQKKLVVVKKSQKSDVK